MREDTFPFRSPASPLAQPGSGVDPQAHPARRADDEPVTLAAETLPAPAGEFGRSRTVEPDVPAEAAETDDQTIKCKTCQNDLVVPKATIDKARDEKGKIACPTCHLEFDLDSWEL